MASWWFHWTFSASSAPPETKHTTFPFWFNRWGEKWQQEEMYVKSPFHVIKPAQIAVAGCHWQLLQDYAFEEYKVENPSEGFTTLIILSVIKISSSLVLATYYISHSFSTWMSKCTNTHNTNDKWQKNQNDNVKKKKRKW